MNKDERAASTSASTSTPKSRQLPRGVAIAACVVAIAGALAACNLVKPRSHMLSDSGSAPEFMATLYTMLTGTADPASQGAFQNRAADKGPLHLDSSSIWLGSGLGEASDDSVAVVASQMGSEQGTEPFTPTPLLVPCIENNLVVVISSRSMSEGWESHTAYLNVFADWNRDGRFVGADECADEWAIKNLPIPGSELRDQTLAFPVSLLAGVQTLEFWLRVSITLDEQATGDTPSHPYKDGETEDVLVSHLMSHSSTRDPRRAKCVGSLPLALEGGSRARMQIGVPASSRSSSTTEEKSEDFEAVLDDGTRLDGVGRLDSFSGTAFLDVPKVSEPRYGFVRSASGRCRFVVFSSSEAKEESSLAKKLRSSPLTYTARATFSQSDPGVPYCLDQAVYSGTSTLVPIHRLPPGPSSGLDATSRSEHTPTAEKQTSIALSQDRASAELMQEVTETRLSSFPISSSAYFDSKGALRALSVQTAREAGGVRYLVELSSSIGAPTHTACVLQVVDLTQEGPENLEPAPLAEAKAVKIAGDYDLTFAKKSDSCGRFELRFDETVRIRQYGDRIEIQRKAGNLSTGQITPPTTLRATGSGQDKSGVAYIEAYNAKIVEGGISGTYELQLDSCRASFEIEGVRR